jgi:hypothetical protein
LGKENSSWLDMQVGFGSIAYNIWRTGDELRHDGVPKTEKQLLKHIFWEIRSRVVGVKVFPRIRDNILLCSLWNLPVGILA